MKKRIRNNKFYENSPIQVLSHFRIPVFVTTFGVFLSILLYIWVLQTELRNLKYEFTKIADNTAMLVRNEFRIKQEKINKEYLEETLKRISTELTSSQDFENNFHLYVYEDNAIEPILVFNKVDFGILDNKTLKSDVIKRAPYYVEREIFSPKNNFQIVFIPSFKYQAGTTGMLPWIVFGLSMIITVLASALVFRATTQRLKIIQEVAIATSALAESGMRLRNIFENAIDGIITLNSKGIVQSYNPACQRLFGYSETEVVGNNIKMLLPKTDKKIADLKTSGISIEMEGKRKDNSTFPMDIAISQFEVDDETIFTWIIRDISERKEAELQRDKLVDKLSESNEELERFAFVASHDLQEPLRMIRNFTQLLERDLADNTDNAVKKYMEIVISSAARMQELVDDLLEYARVGEEVEKAEEINTEDILKYVLGNLKERIDATNAEINYAKLPLLLGSRIRFSCLLQNLLSNAIKYQPNNNKPIIDISYKSDGNFWLFSIADNGIGMKQQYCKQIFEPFKRLHGKNEYAGTGIGLAICKKIVENMGGKIWAVSQPEKGSIFYFTIPKIKTAKPLKKKVIRKKGKVKNEEF